MTLIEFLKARLDEDERFANDIHDRSADAYMDGDCTCDYPKRVLAEVEAKRRLLEQFRLRGDSVRATVQPSTGGVWDDLLRLLALPYTDHPDYRQEWRP